MLREPKKNIFSDRALIRNSENPRAVPSGHLEFFQLNLKRPTARERRDKTDDRYKIENGHNLMMIDAFKF